MLTFDDVKREIGLMPSLDLGVHIERNPYIVRRGTDEAKRIDAFDGDEFEPPGTRPVRCPPAAASAFST
jgi:hypothetical protein